MNENSILPTNYGDTKIALLPRDPVWLFTYWEIPQSAKDNLSRVHGDNFIPSFLILRVYDVTNVDFNGTNANRSFDIRISEKAESWYINVGEFNRAWLIEIGYILKDGSFTAVARSNTIALPKYGVSESADAEQWASYNVFDKELLEQIGATSANIIKFSREREEWNKSFALFKLPSSMPSSLPSSKGASKFFQPEPRKEKFFWLRADTEIIVYGATDPDCSLTIAGRQVPLEKDGSFSLRFYLPEGGQEYLIEAVSSDKTMSKRLIFNIVKQTK
jgi:hypothetical protein